MSVRVIVPLDRIPLDPVRLQVFVSFVGPLYKSMGMPVEGYESLSAVRGTVIQQVAKARNRALAFGEDSFVFNDADSLCRPEQIQTAVRLAEMSPGLVFAYTSYCRLSQRATEALMSWRDAFEAPVEWEMVGSLSSGCVAISRESFLEAGGYDESWLDGYEDYDFALRCNERWPNRRVEGELVHLWHPRPAVEPENGRDRRRFEERWGPKLASTH